VTELNETSSKTESGKYVDGFPVTEITKEQSRKFEETVSMMTWTAPGFLHILYKLLNAQNNAGGKYVAIMSRSVPIAATDGQNIIFNPDTYFAEGLGERTYIMAHEIIHVVYDDIALLHHCHETGYVPMPDGTRLPFIEPILQRAMDARINALIDESKIGTRPKDGWFDKTVKGGASVFEVYKKYYENHQKNPQSNQPGDKPGDKPGNSPQQGKGKPEKTERVPSNPGGFDVVLKPGQATGKREQQALAERNPQQWAVELAQAKALEELCQGDLPAGMKILFRELLEPEVNWLDHIETLVMRHVGDDGVDWTQPNPWLGSTEVADYFVPSSTGTGAGWVVIWGDTSGSVNNERVQARNISEIAGLMEQVRPRRLTLIWCDCKLYDGKSVVEITDPADLATVEPVGGGGTSYGPVLNWIRDNGDGEVPDLWIAFTDGEVSHQKEPAFPVIWACNTNKAFPFGQVVRVNNGRK
jgi:predicted metal-dependent peptidase